MSTAKIRRERPARRAAPPLPSFDSLDKTHRRVLQTLVELAELIDRLAAQGMDDAVRAQAREICAFFDETARSHHVAEEQIVFPSLLTSGNEELVALVRHLQQDHGWLEEDWLELGPQLKAVAEGYNWYDLDALRAGIPIFADLYRDHIALEETMIYPEARRREELQRAAEEQRRSAK